MYQKAFKSIFLRGVLKFLCIGMLDHGRFNGKFSFVLNINDFYIENKLNLIRTNDSTIFLPFLKRNGKAR